MKTLQAFISTIKTKDVEDNRTYVYCNFEGCGYGQSYQNATMSIEEMKDRFAVFYYQFYQQSHI